MLPFFGLMKYLVLCYWLAVRVAWAQNLVPNPSFEAFGKCPISFSTDPAHFGPNSWNSPTNGTPDYFNKCSIGEMDVPRNWAGVSFAHSGVGYAGIYAWSTGKHNYREYVQCKLNEPLKAGMHYDIQFFFRLSSYSVYAIDRIGLGLSSTEVKVSHDSLLNLTPVLTKVNKLETLTNEWYKVAGQITAKGGEQFLVIGNFSSNDSTANMKIVYREGKSLMLGNSAYYYVDDVSVFPVENLEEETPDLEAHPPIKPNEVYILKHINFAFDSYKLLPSSFAELDYLISILKQHPEWKVELNGHTDDQGTDEYNLTLSANRAKSVGEYLTQHGIKAEIIQTKGFGKQKPLRTGNDEQTRSLNRRVEVKFSER